MPKMHEKKFLFLIFLVFENAVCQFHLGSRIYNNIRKGVRGEAEAGLGGALGGASHLIGGAESLLSDTTGKVRGIFHHGKKELDDEVLDDIKHSSSASHNQENINHGKHNEKHHPNGHNKNGHRFRSDILTPIEELLGLTHIVCQVSNAGEGFIEKFGKLHLASQNQIKYIDHAVADYVTFKIVLRFSEFVRRGHVRFFSFFTDTHIALVRFGTNCVIEIYRVIKSPLEELLACN
ncbi:hypothetical protein WA026_016997 [Henosepilachna vigintioctopunctata]|uniref:Uncharacterized protein n=1 Tax=Henosepilachna vigintioctopunctata TaxID=420089 RepID=A0AAW1U9I7_9CUCU